VAYHGVSNVSIVGVPSSEHPRVCWPRGPVEIWIADAAYISSGRLGEVPKVRFSPWGWDRQRARTGGMLAFLRELVERGFRTPKELLVVLGGSKGLRPAVREVTWSYNVESRLA
jgi:hypothetical protein